VHHIVQSFFSLPTFTAHFYIMKPLSLVFVLFLSISFVVAQDLQSPAQFLGYPVGAKYTRHHRVVEYFKSVAQAKPEMVKLEKYGETNEGRELLITIIASPENLKRVDQIRHNNLAMAGVLNDNTSETLTDAPAIVWLSYNVHGNETSSSEAAMLTLYTLVDPKNVSSKEWLKNLIVIIDPCINPDGRDRYVNWFNSMVGMHANPEPLAREHVEPWPGGRSNHYNFDLNRDWAWQTQVESQQRLKKYNEWLPQVHVDYHEQGYDQPYYFAPAAEPYHELITQWQRDFQGLIGKSNASYFDKNGWLFFTKERFDLLYPSYGDTYPIYKGAIGMTFEQGGIRSGLAIVNKNGDTLTLTDRVMHHYTTGLSTIETSSKNQTRLLKEFKQFFTDNKSGKIGEYKTYVLTSKDENKLLAVKKLFDQNGIESGTISNKFFKGYNYFTGKEESYVDEGLHLAISTYQSNAVLAKVLLEPKTKLTDSNTYDITAWAIPFAYGIKTYAVKEKLEVNTDYKTASVIINQNSSYGLLIPYTSLNAAKVLAYLLKNNVKVRYATVPFNYHGKEYDRGTLVVLKTSNGFVNWNTITNEACTKYHIQSVPVETGMMDKGADFGSSDIRVISSAPKVALISGEQSSSLGAGEIWQFFDQQLDYPVTLVNANDLGRFNLKNYQVLIIPDGNYKTLTDKVTTDKLKDFVKSGGKLIAIESAADQLAGADWGIKLKEDKTEDKSEYASLKKFADQERSALTGSIPGAIYKVDLDNTHPLAFGYPDYYYTLKQDSNLYDFMKEGWNVGVLKKEGYITGFSGIKVKSKLKDGTLFGVQPMGAGSVIYLADNLMFRQFWENGKLLFCNAVFLAAQ
jgi:hypothetical protein